MVHADKVDDGQMSSEGVGMRFTNAGLAGLGPVIESLAGGAFDIGGLLMAQNPIINQQDAFLTLDIVGNVYEAGIGGVTLSPQSTEGGVADADLDQRPLRGREPQHHRRRAHQHRLRARAADPARRRSTPCSTSSPPSGDESKVDVNMIGTPTVDTGTVGYEFISGICDGDTFVIGDIVDAVAGPQVQALVGDGFATNLGDPDGAGPADSPIADAIETALGEISIAGSVGEAIQAHLDAPFTAIDETASAIDFRADADFFATPGATPADCAPVPGAPDLAATVDVPGEYPTLGDTTPGGQPYGMGLVISASAFNQLLGTMAECGILNQSITEFALGGGPPLPITSSLLGALIPEFGSKLPPGTPMRAVINPTVAPFLTSEPGPNGEMGELMLANLEVSFVQDLPEHDRDVADPRGRRAAGLRARLRPRRRPAGADDHPAAGERGGRPGGQQLDRDERAQHRGAVPGPVPDVRRRRQRVVRLVPAARVLRAQAQRARGRAPRQPLRALRQPRPGPADPPRERAGHRPVAARTARPIRCST